MKELIEDYMTWKPQALINEYFVQLGNDNLNQSVQHTSAIREAMTKRGDISTLGRALKIAADEVLCKLS